MSTPRAAASATGGFAGSLRAIGATLGEMASVRGALFGVELREEMRRQKRRLALAAFAFALLHTALLVTTLLVVVLFWDTYRVGAVASLALVYLGCGAAALHQLRIESEAAPVPFEATFSELRRDLVDFRSPR
jgi:uncharacterized membrane protein YqjE